MGCIASQEAPVPTGVAKRSQLICALETKQEGAKAALPVATDSSDGAVAVSIPEPSTSAIEPENQPATADAPAPALLPTTYAALPHELAAAATLNEASTTGPEAESSASPTADAALPNELAAAATLNEASTTVSEAESSARAGSEAATAKQLRAERSRALAEELSAKVRAEGVAGASWADPVTCMRYVRARHGKPAAAEAMLRESLRWRESFGVARLSERFAEIRQASLTGKVRVSPCRDRAGRPVLLLVPRLENQRLDLDGNLANVVYHLERLTGGRPGTSVCPDPGGSPDGKAVVVMDFMSWSLQNSPPMKASRATLSILQNHYPERLHLFVMLNAPALFYIFFRAISPFIDPHTRAKVPTHSLMYSRTPVPTHLHTYSLAHVHTHPLTHVLTHLLTPHAQRCSCPLRYYSRSQGWCFARSFAAGCPLFFLWRSGGVPDVSLMFACI